MTNLDFNAKGDSWCLCASRFKEAVEAGYAPEVILAATHEKVTLNSS